jgi:hypothetical protein
MSKGIKGIGLSDLSLFFLNISINCKHTDAVKNLRRAKVSGGTIDMAFFVMAKELPHTSITNTILITAFE